MIAERDARSSDGGAATAGFWLYLLFVTSWFLRLPARYEILAAVRFDLALICVLAVLALMNGSRKGPSSELQRVLWILILYILVTTPFVYWPGSAIKFGSQNFVKAVAFFYFTVAFVRTEGDLKRFLLVFVACQSIRILEPLYLNITQGYWGSRAHMEGTEYLNRLSGAPVDIINPNGLAFVICTVLPFLYFLGGLSWKLRLAAGLMGAASLYALALTGSRSGVVGLVAILIGIALTAKGRAAAVFAGAAGALLIMLGFSLLSPDLQDRYLSILGKGERNVGTAEDRWEGIEAQLGVVLNKPMVGHGLGTSAEANANFTTTGPYAKRALLAHNLYLEVALELGLVGLAIFLFYIKAMLVGFGRAKQAVRRASDASAFLPRVIDAMQVWIAMNLIFSFASYGLSSYEWYLFGGLSVALLRLTEHQTARAPSRPPGWVLPGGATDDAKHAG